MPDTGRKVVHAHSRRLNPEYEDRPECGQCHERVASVRTVYNKMIGRSVDACATCRRDVGIVNEIWAKRQAGGGGGG